MIRVYIVPEGRIIRVLANLPDGEWLAFSPDRPVFTGSDGGRGGAPVPRHHGRLSPGGLPGRPGIPCLDRPAGRPGPEVSPEPLSRWRALLRSLGFYRRYLEPALWSAAAVGGLLFIGLAVRVRMSREWILGLGLIGVTAILAGFVIVWIGRLPSGLPWVDPFSTGGQVLFQIGVAITALGVIGKLIHYLSTQSPS